jgi:predicted Zn-dependent protease
VPYTIRIAIAAIAAAGLALFAHERVISARANSVRDIQSTAGRVDLPSRSARRARIALVRAELQRAEGPTYVAEILGQSDSALARWPERTTRPVSVWIQDSTNVKGWWKKASDVAWEAFQEWERTGIPVRFFRTSDSAMANIRLVWIDRFPTEITGRTTWARNGRWWITDAEVTLAMRHSNGAALDRTAMRAIALHEVGHLLGLAHSTDSLNVMSPTVRVSKLSPADLATVQLLYRLPPGPVRD